MSSSSTEITFAPSLRIFSGAHDTQLVVAFDTLSPLDLNRGARSLRIPSSFRQMTFDLEGFDSEVPAASGDQRMVAGKINLVVVDEEGKSTTHMLADCQLKVPFSGKPKKGASTLPSPQHVAYAVRHGTSDALESALADHFGNQARQESSIPAATVPTAPIRATAERSASQARPNGYRRNMMLAMVGAPVLVYVLIWGVSRALAPAPEMQAALAAQPQDPSSIANQVELTKQTLQQMGLDPGQGSDLGCLTPQ